MGSKAKADVLQQKSPAEFFAENKNIAGFDNVRGARAGGVLCAVAAWRADQPRSCLLLQPGKCLYTTIRELVENALDSAESIKVLPDIEITM